MASHNALVGSILVIVWNDLVENGDDEHRGFAHARFRLTKNILSLQSVRNGVDLDLAGMLEAAFTNCPFELILEE